MKLTNERLPLRRSRAEEREVYKRYRGQLGPGMKVETHSCVGSVGEVVFTCSALGFLHRWEGRNLMSSVRGHTSGIRTCYVLRGQGDEQVQMQPCKRSNLPSCMYGMVCMQGLVTGCNSGKVVVWTNKLEVSGQRLAGCWLVLSCLLALTACAVLRCAVPCGAVRCVGGRLVQRAVAGLRAAGHQRAVLRHADLQDPAQLHILRGEVKRL